MSSNVKSVLLENDILLESGTNEVEILVFRVGAYHLGINVAKVREILMPCPITHLPKAHASVLGCFQLRNAVVPCVSLHRHLGQSEPSDGGKVILTEFNHSQTAFVVDDVERIFRINWETVQPSPPIVNESNAPLTGVTELQGQLVGLLDFETIAAEIAGEHLHRVESVEQPEVERSNLRIVCVDDSNTVRNAVKETLRQSGYENVTCFENGREAWTWLQEQFGRCGDASQLVDLIVSDVEMPSMDGFHLTWNIKQHPHLQKIPVVLYSSIVTPDNLKKGQAVRADAQIGKPDLSRVVDFADEILRTGSIAATPTSPLPVG